MITQPNDNFKLQAEKNEVKNSVEETLSSPNTPDTNVRSSDAVSPLAKIKLFFQILARNLTVQDHHSKSQPTLLGHLLITVGSVCTLFMIYLILGLFVENNLKSWNIHHLPERSESIDLTSKPGLTSARLSQNTLNSNQIYQQILVKWLPEIDQRVVRHSKMTIFFYKHYAVSNILTAALAISTGLLIFLISKEGWDKANRILINLFIVTGSSVIFLGELPNIFQYDENFQRNRESYLEYINLREKVKSYLILIDDYNSDELNQILDFIHREMKGLNQLHLKIMPTNINALKDSTQNLFPGDLLPSQPVRLNFEEDDFILPESTSESSREQ